MTDDEIIQQARDNARRQLGNNFGVDSSGRDYDSVEVAKIQLKRAIANGNQRLIASWERRLNYLLTH